MGIEMNLKILKRTNKSPVVGDLFTMMLPDDRYLFGRVMDTDANPLGKGGGVLIYIYKEISASKQKTPNMMATNLLVPPIITNKQPWTKGYFETIANYPVRKGEQLGVHCFKDSRGWYFNEQGTRLKEKTDPVGEWGLHSYRTIDDAISMILGIPLSPED